MLGLVNILRVKYILLLLLSRDLVDEIIILERLELEVVIECSTHGLLLILVELVWEL